MRSAFGCRAVVGVLALLAGCGHKVTLSYVAPAQVGIDPEIVDLLVIDQSVPAHRGAQVVDAVEGLSTGEGYDLDRDTAAVAIQALHDVLGETGRFDVTALRLDGKPVDLEKACKKVDCDAIVALTAIDSDTRAQVTVERERGEPPAFHGRSATDLTATFTTYDADGNVLDTAQLAADDAAVSVGERRVDAAAAATAGPELQTAVAGEVGTAYGERIAPHRVRAERTLYRTGSPELRRAADLADAGKWDKAEDVWREVVQSGTDRERAKARHDLAIAAERDGRLDRALQLARNADDALESGRTGRYVDALEQRWVDAQRLKRQMPDGVADAS